MHTDQPVSCFLIKEARLGCQKCVPKTNPKLVEVDERGLQSTARKLVGQLQRLISEAVKCLDVLNKYVFVT